MSAEALAALRAPYGTFVVMGNHERHLPPEAGEMPFHRSGLTVLCNQAQEIWVDGASLWILGLDDLLRGHGDLSLALRGVPDEACKVLLVHEPDFADRAACYPIDLQLSGHTHGGQVRLPGVGALILPKMGHKYPMGLYRVRHMWLYTNRGLGTDSLPMRFYCRPEITLFTLRSAPANRTAPALEGM
jgi:predicted MPP superfamily phosphohydrolase